MKTTKFNEMPDFVFNFDGCYDCKCCDDGEILVSEGYDIYGNEFNFGWECDCCDYRASLSGRVVKYQRYDEDQEMWVDDDSGDADCISWDSEHFLDKADIDGTTYLVYVGTDYKTDTKYRAVIEDAVFCG